eukprot:8515195-Pyramimonas_sp.AAC.1
MDGPTPLCAGVCNACPAEGVCPIHPYGGQTVRRFVKSAPDGLPSEYPACSLDLPRGLLHLPSQV